MRKIVLLCQAGMSTGMLVNKMRTAAKEESYECTIDAFAVSSAAEHARDADIILLGPQVRFHRKTVEQACPGILIMDIDMQSYGTMNGKKVLDELKENLGD